MSRNEELLKALTGEASNITDPLSRMELYLHALLGEPVTVPEPISRNEKILYKLLGYDIEIDPEPQSRVESYLLYMLGYDVALPFPQSRIEKSLAKWVQSGEENLVTWISAYGNSTQDGTPTPANPVEIINTDTVIGGGKNLLTNKGYDADNNGVKWTSNDDGTISVKGTAANTSFSNTVQLNMTAPQIITFSILSENVKMVVDADGELKYISPNSSRTFLAGTIINSVKLSVAGGLVVDEVIRIQLEIGREATIFTPYTPVNKDDAWREVFEEIYGHEPMGIGDVKDELVINIDEGSSRLIQRIGVVDLNDITTWAKTGDGEGLNGTGFAGACPSLKSSTAIMCNMFRSSRGVVNAIINQKTSAYNIRIITNVADNPNDFKQWIKDNRVIIYSPLTDPVINGLSVEQQDRILKSARYVEPTQDEINTVTLLNIMEEM